MAAPTAVPLAAPAAGVDLPQLVAISAAPIIPPAIFIAPASDANPLALLAIPAPEAIELFDTLVEIPTPFAISDPLALCLRPLDEINPSLVPSFRPRLSAMGNTSLTKELALEDLVANFSSLLVSLMLSVDCNWLWSMRGINVSYRNLPKLLVDILLIFLILG
jgi:hypothetical protein